jgi:hypothetical protein
VTKNEREFLFDSIRTCVGLTEEARLYVDDIDDVVNALSLLRAHLDIIWKEFELDKAYEA